MSENTTGWARPTWPKQFHYFRDGKALCKRWMFLSNDPKAFENFNHEHAENCTQCKKKVLKEIRERMDKQAMEGFQNIEIRVFATLRDSDCPKCWFTEIVRLSHVPEGSNEIYEMIHTCRKCKHDFEYFKNNNE